MIVSSIDFLGEYDDYVYDIETVDGTFAASSYSDNLDILCKNTDSCYVRFDIPKENYTDSGGYFNEIEFMREHFRLSNECAQRISSEFKSPIKLAFEKIMYPFFLYEKKRYAYREWTKPEYPNGIECKGLSLVRSDYCIFTKKTIEDILNILMIDKSLEDGMEFAKTQIRRLLVEKKIPIEELIISKSLRNTYKLKSKEIKWCNGLCTIHDCEKPKKEICKNCDACNGISGELGKMLNIGNTGIKKECSDCAKHFEEISGPHVTIATRLRLKDPVNGPKPPDRIEYLYVQRNGKSLKQNEFTVHPSELDKNKIDFLYYFEHQLRKPMEQLFSVMCKDTSEIYKDIVREYNNNRNRQSTLNHYFKTE